MGYARVVPPVPSALARLFPDCELAVVLDPAHRAFLVGRILEEGDGADLAWLVSAVGEGAIAGWVRERGERQLSRRSRLFWEAVLGVRAGAVGEERPSGPAAREPGSRPASEGVAAAAVEAVPWPL